MAHLCTLVTASTASVITSIALVSSLVSCCHHQQCLSVITSSVSTSSASTSSALVTASTGTLMSCESRLPQEYPGMYPRVSLFYLNLPAHHAPHFLCTGEPCMHTHAHTQTSTSMTPSTHASMHVHKNVHHHPAPNHLPPWISCPRSLYPCTCSPASPPNPDLKVGPGQAGRGGRVAGRAQRLTPVGLCGAFQLQLGCRRQSRHPGGEAASVKAFAAHVPPYLARIKEWGNRREKGGPTSV